MTRQEHLAWSETRALEYLDRGQDDDVAKALASFYSDLGKHDETRPILAQIGDLFQKTAVIEDRPLSRSFARALIESVVEVTNRVDP